MDMDDMDSVKRRGMFSSSRKHQNPGSEVNSNLSSTNLRHHGNSLTRDLFNASQKNKLGKDMLPSFKSVKDEKVRQSKLGFFVIHPFSDFRYFWDLIISIVLILTVFLLPIHVVFYNNELRIPWVAFMTSTDTLFLVDVVINMFTGIVLHETKQVILDRYVIVTTYLKKWFIIDLISSFPFDLLYYIYYAFSGTGATKGAIQILRIARIVSLLRMLRMSRIIRYIAKLERILVIRPAWIRIINLIGILMMYLHLNACYQVLVPLVMGYPETSWVAQNGLDPQKDRGYVYSVAVFRSVAQATGAGWGLTNPENLVELWMVSISFMWGMAITAFLVGAVIDLLSSLDSSGRAYFAKMSEIREYLNFRKVPKNIQQRAIRYFEFKYHRKYFDEKGVVSELPTSLQRLLLSYKFKTLITKQDFFFGTSKAFSRDICSHLRPEIFLPGDVIVKAGMTAEGMYFVESGKAEVYIGMVGPLLELEDGDVIGEMEVLNNTSYGTTILAKEVCLTYYISKDNLLSVFNNHPGIKFSMLNFAHERKQTRGNIIGNLVKSERRDNRLRDPIASTRSVSLDEPRPPKLSETSKIFASLDIEHIEKSIITESEEEFDDLADNKLTASARLTEISKKTSEPTNVSSLSKEFAQEEAPGLTRKGAIRLKTKNEGSNERDEVNKNDNTKL